MGTMIQTIADLKSEAAAKGGHFFDASAMRYFNSRILSGIYRQPGETADRGYFVTSERYEDDPRMYTVRSYDNGADRVDIDQVSEFQQYETAAEAIKAAKFVAGIK